MSISTQSLKESDYLRCDIRNAVKVASGGMAEIFRANVVAHDEEMRLPSPAKGPLTEPVVAIKRLLPAFRDEPYHQELFWREAFLGQRLDHPHIVKVYGMALWESDPVIVMEYVDGISLRKVLPYLQTGQINLPGIVWDTLALQLVHAVEHVHQRGLIHRDISPHNLLLASGGALKLCDFGIASDIQKVGTLVQEERIIGKKKYLAPEVIEENHYSNESDWYAVGKTLSELMLVDAESRRRAPLWLRNWNERLLDQLTHKHAHLRTQEAKKLVCEIDAESQAMLKNQATRDWVDLAVSVGQSKISLTQTPIASKNFIQRALHDWEWIRSQVPWTFILLLIFMVNWGFLLLGGL